MWVKVSRPSDNRGGTRPMSRAPMPYEIIWTEAAKADVRLMPAFHRPPILEAVQQLRHQASFSTRNRKPLAEPLAGMPPGTWEVRVGEYRVLYWIEEERTVHVLRAIFKGSSPLRDVLARGRTP
jgi:mRNA-degrading endonuclease RelE of RelBE toxin-antitoxin system